jgi:hypothetical protein
MPSETASGPDFSFHSYAEAWLGICDGAAILSRAGLEGIALFWNLRRPYGHSLAALSRTLDAYMRSPRFLHLMKHSLRMMSWPSSFGFPTPFYPSAFASSKERPTHV